MNSEIKNVKLKFACDADWSNMTDVDGAKHCNACNKKVYDFTDAKPYEFLAILADNNHNICGRFRFEQMAADPIYVPVWKKWASAALVLIGVHVFSGKARAQSQQPIQISQPTAKDDPGFFTGVVLVNNAEFPGGQPALIRFISRNLKFQKGMTPEKVFVQFTIKKDGSLTDYKIMRGANAANNAEVLRVLKLSPKWKPSINNGHVAETTYVLPVTIELQGK